MGMLPAAPMSSKPPPRVDASAPDAPELPALIDGMLAQLEAALGPIQDDTIDTRFIDGLLVLAPGAALRDV